MMFKIDPNLITGFVLDTTNIDWLKSMAVTIRDRISYLEGMERQKRANDPSSMRRPHVPVVLPEEVIEGDRD